MISIFLIATNYTAISHNFMSRQNRSTLVNTNLLELLVIILKNSSNNIFIKNFKLYSSPK